MLRYYFIFLMTLAVVSVKAQEEPYVVIFGQELPENYEGPFLSEEYDIPILEEMKAVYSKPDGLEEVIGFEYFRDYLGLRKIIKLLMDHQLVSTDGEFIATFSLPGKLYTQEHIDYYFWDRPELPNKLHENYIKGVITDAYGEIAGINWRDYVNFYSPEDAKQKFNADNAIRFPIELEPENYYKEKYKNLEFLVIQKNDRGNINLFCFYTDKAKENFDYYWEKVESIFRYED